MGGAAGTANGERSYIGTANVKRTDVNAVYNCGNYHGFSVTFTTSKRGNQPVYIYAINDNGGINPLIGVKTVNITNR